MSLSFMHADYLQPDFYRFSEDSLKLVRYVHERLISSSALKVLDLCAGSGVVGIEFALKSKVESLDFCEIQSEFLPFLQKNREMLLKEVKGQIYHQNYEHFFPTEKYDLILSNPPYFFQGRGMMSPQREKNRCRFFMDSTLLAFLLCLARSLRPGGEAYFLVRENEYGMKEELSKAFSKLSVDYQLNRAHDFGSCTIYRMFYVN